jgi:hypothetical protein
MALSVFAAATPQSGAAPWVWSRRAWWVGVLAVALIVGILLGWPAFSRWQVRRMLIAGAAFLQQRDFRNAGLAARQALALHPGDPQAVTLLAEIATATGSPEAILWWERLVTLRPGDPAPLIELAQAALRADDPIVAGQALARLDPALRDSVAVHSLAGSIALLERDWVAAETHFSAAARLDPVASQPALNLAAFRLRLPNGPEAAAARAEMRRLRLLPECRLPALRSLLADARARSDFAEARTLATEMHDAPEAAPDDRLALLDELFLHSASELEKTLLGDEAKAASDVSAAAALGRWVNAHGFAALGAGWIDGMPERMRAQPVLLLVRAESAVATADWMQVRARTDDGGPDWQALDFLRLALAARAAVELDGGRRGPQSAARWERSLNSTGGNAAALSMLAREVQGWDWKAEAAEAWWLVARHPWSQRTALRRLWELAATDRDTPELLRVAKRIVELDSQNAAARNNLAWLELLRGEDLPGAEALAARNLAEHPDSPGLKSTSALSLSLQRRHDEAVALIAGLPEEARHDPATSAGAGAVLTAAGRRAEAQTWLDVARAHESELLPEERALVDRALAQP